MSSCVWLYEAGETDTASSGDDGTAGVEGNTGVGALLREIVVVAMALWREPSLCCCCWC
jgi:hypothetical protein